MKVLITSGGTREPIDGVRFVTNFSSGVTGAALAGAFARAGWEVVLLRAADARPSSNAHVHEETFGSVADLDAACRELLGRGDIDAVVHAAAVSDYTVSAVVVDGVRHQAPVSGKLDSARSVSVELSPSPKILPRLKSYAPRRIVLVGFKLTNGASAEGALAAIESQIERTDVDLVVHNDLTEIDHGAGRHVASVYDRAGLVATASTNAELGCELVTRVTALALRA